MIKVLAALQVILISLMIAYGTFELFRGNFVQSFAMLPLLFVYYIFVTVRHQRAQSGRDGEDEGENPQ